MKRELRSVFHRLAPRTPHGIGAVLLPYLPSGEVDWQGFESLVRRTHEAGLACAVNMDTGFGDLLSPEERTAVLRATSRTLGPGVSFYAGAYATPAEVGVSAYRAALADIESVRAAPVIVQSLPMHAMAAREKARLYGEIARATPGGAVAFELSPRFAPHGEIWDTETFERILEIPEILGAKHSSLDRDIEFDRLATRDRIRPEFRVYTGNDLAIDMVAYGSDYLLGLATFAPQEFAERDRLLAAADSRFLMQNDALQHLGNVGFRAPIPAYKHAAAQFLHLCGHLTGDAIHPAAPRRPDSERILLLDCALRLGLVDDGERIYRERILPYLEDAAPR